ncbi:MAG: hypothetical protein IKK70_05965 [Clostridia bacterium]|nr:hypothetical protein [Clostridia bacterium]
MFKKFKTAKPIPAIIILVASAILLLSIFLPYSVANKELKEDLLEISETKIDENDEFKAKDLVRVSLMEAARINKTLYEEGVFYVIFIIAIIVFTLLTALSANSKKPFLVLIFNLLAFLLFLIIKVDFANLGVTSNEDFNSGIAFYLIHLTFIANFIGAVWMFIKRKEL